MATHLLQSVAAAIPAVAEREQYGITLLATKATEKKQEALDAADATAIVAISHGKGAIAKQAHAIKSAGEFDGVATSIAAGNLQAFAVIVAAKLGESVSFKARRDTEGNIIAKASDAFRAFRGVLDHKMLQLEAKDKVYTAKGEYTSAAADLAYLIKLHSDVCKKMDERAAEDAARRAKLAAEREAEQQAEKGLIEV